MDHLSIGEFARESGLTPKALRLYGELDLLTPAHVEESNGYRCYARDQLERAHLVARLRLVGMPLARIRSLLELSGPAAAAELEAHWRQVQVDNAARREIVHSLVLDLRARETTMHEPTFHLLSAAVRHAQGAREQQQDAVYSGRSLFAVADGFGDATSAAATIASVAALDETSPVGDPQAALAEAVTVAAASTSGRPGGTTLTVLWLPEGRGVSAHVGDARLLRVRDGEVTRLTRDHTLVAALVEDGRLTEDEARVHPHRVLLNRALTAGKVMGGRPEDPQAGTVDLREIDVRPGDRLTLVTDGVHAVLDPERLEDILTDGGDPEGVAEAVAAEVERAGAPDNYSVVIVDAAV
jgi:serine/threonine protein phosphatase PrpC